MNINVYPASQSGAIPMSNCRCSPGSIWAILVYFGMDLTSIFHSCEFVKVDPPIDPTVIGMVSVILFSLGEVGRRYTDVAPLSDTPDSLSLFSVFVVEVADF